jgi:hypothetical protein
MVLNIRYNTVEAAFDKMSQEQECFVFLHLVTFLIPSEENKTGTNMHNFRRNTQKSLNFLWDPHSLLLNGYWGKSLRD